MLTEVQFNAARCKRSRVKTRCLVNKVCAQFIYETSPECCKAKVITSKYMIFSMKS